MLEAGLGDVPSSARDVILARAARLGPKARETLEAAALIGATVDERLLRDVVAGPALAEVIASGLVVGHPVLRFRHEIARQAIEQAVLPARRSELHARILQGLRTLGCDDDARLAFHAEEAGDGPAALEHAASAGRRARTLASHREAAGQFERALRFADGEAPASIAARWIELATELSMIDRWPDAETAYTRALENWRAAGDRLGEGDTLRRMSIALWRLCRGDEILAAAEAAVAILEPLGPTPELAAAYGNLAAFQNHPGRGDIVVPLAQRAQELAVRFGVPAVQSRAATTEAQAVWLAGGDWEPVLRRALSIALENGIEYEAGFAYTNLHELHCGNRDYAKADPYFHDGVAYCEDHDLGTYYTCLRGVRTSTLERLGRWDESAAIAEAVIASVASPVNRMIPMTSLAMVAARRDAGSVWPHLDAAMTAADGSTGPMYIGAVRLARAEARWLESDLPGRGTKPNSRTTRAPTLPIPGSTARLRCGCDAPDRPGRVSANWPSPTGCSSPETIAAHPNCSMRWAAPTTRRSRCSMRLTSWRCDERSTSATRSGPSRRRGSFARRCARSASGPFRPGSEPRRARIRSA